MACLAVAPALVACGSASAASGAISGPWGDEAVADGVDVTRQCPASVVEGIDVFDGQGAIDWAAVRDAGIAFAFIKATQGTYDTQSTFAGNWRASAAAGVLRGAYHFFDPTEDGAAQAAHFLSVVGSPAAGDLPPVLDVECPDGDPDCLGTGSAGMAAADDIRARLQAFLEATAQGLGRAPVLYTFPSYFADNGVDTAGLGEYPLYLASIPADDDAGVPCFAVPGPWSSAEFWQYSFEGAVPGVAGAVDRDRFLGSIAALEALGGAGPPQVVGCP